MGNGCVGVGGKRKKGCVESDDSIDESMCAEGCTCERCYMHLICVSDAGEECDDEVALALAVKIALKHPNLILDIIFTDEVGRDAFENIYFVESKKALKNKNIHFHSINQLDQVAMVPSKKRILLQIGPIHTTQVSKEELKAFVQSMGTYDYSMVGELGSTTNSKHVNFEWWSASKAPVNALFEGETCAKMLMESASDKVIIDTARGTGAFPFTVCALESLFGKEHPLVTHVLRIGFRNTMGRADPTEVPPMYIAGLVAKGKGANWKTVYRMVEMLGIIYEPEPQDTPRGQQIQQIVDKYFKLCTDNGLKIYKEGEIEIKTQDGRTNEITHHAGDTSSVHRATEQEIKDGYYMILDVTNKQFGVPIELFPSGSPQKWNPAWITHDFEPILSDMLKDELIKNMIKAEESWMNTCTTNSNLPTTPAYDVVGLFAALCMFGMVNGHKNVAYFDESSAHGIKTLLLNEPFRVPAALSELFANLI